MHVGNNVGMPNAAVIFNPTKLDRADLEKVLNPAVEDAGWGESVWFETEKDSPGTEQARSAIDQGCDVVIAVGGDGTVRAVAEGMQGSGVPLALVPQGTGNLLAHHLALPIDDLAASVDIALNGQTRSIDIGLADWTRPDGSKESHAFAVMAGMGLDAQIMSSTDEGLKKRVGVLAYVQAGAVALLKGRRMRLQYRIDGGEPKLTKVHTVLVGNVGTIGKNVTLMPDASIDDGILDVVAARPVGPLGWIAVAWRVLVDNGFLRRLKSTRMRERDDNARELRYLQCTHIDLNLREPEEIELDGDHFGEIRSASIEVARDALAVKIAG